MEINGVANIKIIVDQAEDSQLMHPQIAADIYKQLNLLERYMLAYMDATEPSAAIPAWHDIKEDPKRFPTGKERTDSYKKQMESK